MAAKPMTSETIALTEKKMDMTLDDIIKMSKNVSVKPKKQRVANRNQKVFNNAAQNKSLKAERFINSRSYLRQGVLAQRRSSFQENQFPFTNEAAKRAYVSPIQKRPVNQSRAFHFNKPRVVSQFVQNRAGNGGGFNMKKPVQQAAAPVAVAPKQKPQTLDSLFASMKEQRMMNKNGAGARRNGGGQSRLPWSRNHNYRN